MNRRKNPTYVLLLCIMFFGLVSFISSFQKTQAKAATETVLSDTAISNSKTYLYTDEYLVLKNTNEEHSYLLFKINPTTFTSENINYLVLYSKETLKSAQLQIEYFTDPLDFSKPHISQSIDKNYSHINIKPGWNYLPIIPSSPNEIVGIKVSLITIGEITFYGNVNEVPYECKNKYSPRIEYSPKSIIEEKDQVSDIRNSIYPDPREEFKKYYLQQDVQSSSTTQLHTTRGKTKSTPSQVKGVSTEKITTPTNNIKKKKPKEREPKVGFCTVHDYEQIVGKNSFMRCTLFPTKIKSVTHEKISNKYKITIDSYIPKKLNVVIYKHTCKPKSLFEIKTLFSCVETWSRSKGHAFEPTFTNSVYLEGRRHTTSYKSTSYIATNTLWTTKNFSNKNISVKTQIYGKYKIPDSKTVLRVNLVASDYSRRRLPQATVIRSKYLAFVFNDVVTISQWFGRTPYSKKHTGVDIAVYKKQVLSPQTAEFVSYGWDNYYGKCLSGGNTLKLKHQQNYYTVYMHLLNANVGRGSRIKEGAGIATTGNTGAYNCKPVGYHLHLEVRKGPSQRNVVDPMLHMEIDWTKIRTERVGRHPGQATSDKKQ